MADYSLHLLSFHSNLHLGTQLRYIFILIIINSSHFDTYVCKFCLSILTFPIFIWQSAWCTMVHACPKDVPWSILVPTFVSRNHHVPYCDAQTTMIVTVYGLFSVLTHQKIRVSVEVLRYNMDADSINFLAAIYKDNNKS